MARDLAVAARKERNAALIETMMLAAIADGSVSQLELQTLLRRVLERPEFEGTRPEELNALVEGSVQKLAGAKNLPEIMKSLRSRLPDHRTRMLAFGLATAVAFADNRASRAELGLLKTIQAALGIAEDEVATIVDVVERGGSLAEALGEPPQRLYAEVMVLVSAADGKLTDEEASALVESFAADPAFKDVGPEAAQQLVSAAVAVLAVEGLPRRIEALARGLTTHPQRVTAYALGVRMAKAGGQPHGPEQRVLDLLQATFGLADDEVERIHKES
ncbi:MAG: tellurite resistance TerB family protein [Myxococcota bacterium]|nr:tellurite resistance TerB family protein [Myxococcota bacterium]